MSSSASVPLANGGVPFASQTRRPATSIITNNLPGPVEYYVGTDAMLRVGVASLIPAQPLTVRTRLLRSDDGVITSSEDRILTDGTGTQAVTILNLTEGFLLSVEVTCETASMIRGEIFVAVELCHGTPQQLHRDQLLMQDYVSSGYAVSWPGGLLRLSTEGPGATQYGVQPGGPGAGFDFSVAFATNSRTRLMALQVKLTTSAVVANRIPTINIVAAGGPIYSVAVAAPIPASTVAIINLGVGVGAPSVSSNNHILPIPDNLYIQGLGSVGSTTVALQAADAYTAIVSSTESWIIS